MSGTDDHRVAFACVAIASSSLGPSTEAMRLAARAVVAGSPALTALPVQLSSFEMVIDRLIAEKEAWDAMIEIAPSGW
jgi:hypothetical protein